MLAAAVPLSGCLVRTAVDIATLPVRAASAGIDAVTTSQSERDERRGRELRREEERQGREARERERQAQHNAAEPDANGQDDAPNL